MCMHTSATCRGWVGQHVPAGSVPVQRAAGVVALSYLVQHSLHILLRQLQRVCGRREHHHCGARASAIDATKGTAALQSSIDFAGSEAATTGKAFRCMWQLSRINTCRPAHGCVRCAYERARSTNQRAIPQSATRLYGAALTWRAPQGLEGQHQAGWLMATECPAATECRRHSPRGHGSTAAGRRHLGKRAAGADARTSRQHESCHFACCVLA